MIFKAFYFSKRMYLIVSDFELNKYDCSNHIRAHVTRKLVSPAIYFYIKTFFADNYLEDYCAKLNYIYLGQSCITCFLCNN